MSSNFNSKISKIKPTKIVPAHLRKFSLTKITDYIVYVCVVIDCIMTCTQHMVLYMALWTRSICVIYNVSCNNVLDIIIVYTNNQWTPGDVLEDYDYTKVTEYLPILDKHGYFREGYFTTKDQLQQQSLAHQQQLLQLQQQLDTERRMRRSMALQLDKLQESSDNISTGNIL